MLKKTLLSVVLSIVSVPIATSLAAPYAGKMSQEVRHERHKIRAEHRKARQDHRVARHERRHAWHARHRYWRNHRVY